MSILLQQWMLRIRHLISRLRRQLLLKEKPLVLYKILITPMEMALMIICRVMGAQMVLDFS